MSRLSCVRQTFVRSCSDFRAFMSRLSCVRQTFVRSCSDFRAFFDVSRLCNFERTTPPSCVHLRSGHTCFRLGPQPGIWLNQTHISSHRIPGSYSTPDPSTEKRFPSALIPHSCPLQITPGRQTLLLSRILFGRNIEMSCHIDTLSRLFAKKNKAVFKIKFCQYKSLKSR